MRGFFYCVFNPIECAVNALPPWAYWALGICAALIVIGIIWRLKDFLQLVHRIAGWPGVAGVVGIVGVLFTVLFPKRGKKPDNVSELDDGPDAEPSPTIFRRKPREKPAGKRRRFNFDTNTFED